MQNDGDRLAAILLASEPGCDMVFGPLTRQR